MKEKYLPCLVHAKHVSGYLVHLEFDDGTKKTVDFEPWLSGEVFEPLKNKTFFRAFFLEGGSISWPNGADIAPETLYLAEEVREYGRD
jgi:hypothetical protein